MNIVEGGNVDLQIQAAKEAAKRVEQSLDEFYNNGFENKYRIAISTEEIFDKNSNLKKSDCICIHRGLYFVSLMDVMSGGIPLQG